MAWTWQYQDGSGSVTGTSDPFPSQSDAETWIGESWKTLLDSGVASVVLMEEQREVYGPMSLSPAD